MAYFLTKSLKSLQKMIFLNIFGNTNILKHHKISV